MPYDPSIPLEKSEIELRENAMIIDDNISEIKSIDSSSVVIAKSNVTEAVIIGNILIRFPNSVSDTKALFHRVVDVVDRGDSYEFEITEATLEEAYSKYFFDSR